jgi:hypothetical protein
MRVIGVDFSTCSLNSLNYVVEASGWAGCDGHGEWLDMDFENATVIREEMTHQRSEQSGILLFVWPIAFIRVDVEIATTMIESPVHIDNNLQEANGGSMIDCFSYNVERHYVPFSLIDGLIDSIRFHDVGTYTT